MGVYKAKSGKTKDSRVGFLELDIKTLMVEMRNTNLANLLLKKKQKMLNLSLG